MTTKVIMPQMGESIFEGTLTKWLKKVGDTVTRDEPLFEISTDKVDSEIPSPASGILTEILVFEGKTIQINTVLAIIEDAGIGDSAEAPAAGPPKEVIEPARGHEALSGFKPTPAIVSQEIGKPEQISVPSAKGSLSTEVTPSIQIQDIRTSPLVRRLARENNVDLSKVKGTGLEGRITKDDLLAYLAQPSTLETDAVLPTPVQQETSVTGARVIAQEVGPHAPEKEAAAVEPGTTEIPRFVGDGEVVAMTPMRKAISEHMVLSKRTSAHVNTVFEVDVSSLVRLRETHKSEFEKREGIPLTFTPFIAKALVDTVREFPVLNSSVAGESIVFKKPVHLGVAVALDSGLIVPVVKDAQLKSFTGLALAIYDLSERARNKKLRPDDVKNGTISMTNPGRYGALFNTPIINQPQVAILGVGGIEKRPVVVNDAIAIRSMVCLSLTFDHRVIDGAVADQFMASLKQRLQSWHQWSD